MPWELLALHSLTDGPDRPQLQRWSKRTPNARSLTEVCASGVEACESKMILALTLLVWTCRFPAGVFGTGQTDTNPRSAISAHAAPISAHRALKLPAVGRSRTRTSSAGRSRRIDPGDRLAAHRDALADSRRRFVALVPPTHRPSVVDAAPAAPPAVDARACVRTHVCTRTARQPARPAARPPTRHPPVRDAGAGHPAASCACTSAGFSVSVELSSCVSPKGA